MELEILKGIFRRYIACVWAFGVNLKNLFNGLDVLYLGMEVANVFEFNNEFKIYEILSNLLAKFTKIYAL